MTFIFFAAFLLSGVICAGMVMASRDTRNMRLFYAMMWVFWIFAFIIGLFGVS